MISHSNHLNSKNICSPILMNTLLRYLRGALPPRYLYVALSGLVLIELSTFYSLLTTFLILILTTSNLNQAAIDADTNTINWRFKIGISSHTIYTQETKYTITDIF